MSAMPRTQRQNQKGNARSTAIIKVDVKYFWPVPPLRYYDTS